MSSRQNTRISTWLIIGVVILIILLLVWLTIADLWGDTDVAASVTPLLSTTLNTLAI